MTEGNFVDYVKIYQFVPRTFTPLSLSYDHRAVNGADAAKFTTYLRQVLGDIRHLVM